MIITIIIVIIIIIITIIMLIIIINSNNNNNYYYYLYIFICSMAYGVAFRFPKPIPIYHSVHARQVSFFRYYFKNSLIPTHS